MNKTIFIAAMLAVATLLAPGLVVFPGAVQEAQANLCSVEGGQNADVVDLDCDFEGIGSLTILVYSNDNDNVPLGELPLPLPSE